MLRKGAPSFWIVVHKCIHTYDKKRCRIVDVRPLEISVHIDLEDGPNAFQFIEVYFTVVG